MTMITDVFTHAMGTYSHPADVGSEGPNTPLVEHLTSGPGLEQGKARRIARALGGLAVGANAGANGWRLGGWAPHATWIVTSLDRAAILHDGIDRRSDAERAERPVEA